MPRIKQNEAIVYRAVESGELEIDRQGRIWRVRLRVYNSRIGAVEIRPCPRVRADHASGTMRLMRVLIDGRRYETTASRLVWLHFNGPIPTGMLVKHINGREDDNRPKNLELATASEMQLHRLHVLGVGQRVLNQSGARNHAAKLTEAQARRIRSERKSGASGVALARKFGVSESTVSKVCTGKRWADVTSSVREILKRPH